MYTIDVGQPLTLILLVTVAVLAVFLGREIKKPHAPALILIGFLVLIILHSLQLAFLPELDQEANRTILVKCIGIDFVLIFVSFIAYLWVDDISCKFYKKKSIDNSLDWFWNNV